jgi:hypothetical protein
VRYRLRARAIVNAIADTVDTQDKADPLDMGHTVDKLDTGDTSKTHWNSGHTDTLDVGDKHSRHTGQRRHTGCG